MGLSDTLDIGGDMTVCRLGFGTVRLTGPNVWGPPEDPAGCRALLRRAVDAGVDFIDTSSSYGPHTVEELIAAALHPYPDGLIIATKAGLAPTGPGNFARDGRPDHIRASCLGSLARLRLEQIDLFQLHAVDPLVPIEESLGAFVDLQSEGLIRHVGLSNVSVDELRRARSVVDIVSVQNCYNVADRLHEPVLEECTSEAIAFMPWFPLARGEITRSGNVLENVAMRLDVTPAQLALAWLLHKSPVMLPIPGTSNPRHFDANQAAIGIRLEDTDLRILDEIHLRTGPLVDDPSR